jgi:hypothetical protein
VVGLCLVSLFFFFVLNSSAKSISKFLVIFVSVLCHYVWNCVVSLYNLVCSCHICSLSVFFFFFFNPFLQFIKFVSFQVVSWTLCFILCFFIKFDLVITGLISDIFNILYFR